MAQLPSRDLLLTLFAYDPKTGHLTWKVNCTGGTHAGDKAGYVGRQGYVLVKVGGNRFRAHRLIFLMMTGEAPDMIDHRDTNRRNNAWSNMRVASSSQNAANHKLRKNNTTGYKGVTFNRRLGKYQADIRWGRGNPRYLGLFNTPEEAHAAYCEAADKRHGEYANHG